MTINGISFNQEMGILKVTKTLETGTLRKDNNKSSDYRQTKTEINPNVNVSFETTLAEEIINLNNGEKKR